MRFGLLIVLSVLLYSPFAYAGSEEVEQIQEPLSDFEIGKYQYCGNDNDCVAVQNGCCDCANGGQDIAINKSRVEAFKKRFDCVNVACTMRAAIPACGQGFVSCVSHKCQYFAPDKFKE